MVQEWGDNMAITDFASTRPGIRPSGLANIAAIRRGKIDKERQEDRGREEQVRQLASKTFDSWKQGQTMQFQQGLAEMATIDQDSAIRMGSVFGSIDRTNFVNSAFHIYNAARTKDKEAQDTSLNRAAEALNTSPSHPFMQGIDEILAMPYGTEEEKKARDERIAEAVVMAETMGAYGDTLLQRDKLAAGATDRNLDIEKLYLRYQEHLLSQKKEKRISAQEQEKINLAKREHEWRTKNGTIPTGYMVDPNNLNKYIPVPGTEADQARKREKSSQIKKWSSAISKGERLKKQIEGAIDAVDWKTAGPVGTLARFIPGTEGKDLASQILTVKANIGFDRLQKMRDESPTGGALGQVAIQELDALQNSIAALEQSQSPTQLGENLKIVLDHYTAFLEEAKKLHEGIQKLDPNEMWVTIPGTAGTPENLKDASTEDLLNQF
jgi:hypothetical protein